MKIEIKSEGNGHIETFTAELVNASAVKFTVNGIDEMGPVEIELQTEWPGEFLFDDLAKLVRATMKLDSLNSERPSPAVYLQNDHCIGIGRVVPRKIPLYSVSLLLTRDKHRSFFRASFWSASLGELSKIAAQFDGLHQHLMKLTSDN